MRIAPIIEDSIKNGLDPVQMLLDCMAEKDSPMSRKWAEITVARYKMTNYQKWCAEKKLPAYTAEKFLQFMMFTDPEAENQQVAVYNMRWAVFVRQTMSVVRELMARLEKAMVEL